MTAGKDDMFAFLMFGVVVIAVVRRLSIPRLWKPWKDELRANVRGVANLRIPVVMMRLGLYILGYRMMDEVVR